MDDNMLKLRFRYVTEFIGKYRPPTTFFGDHKNNKLGKDTANTSSSASSRMRQRDAEGNLIGGKSRWHKKRKTSLGKGSGKGSSKGSGLHNEGKLTLAQEMELLLYPKETTATLLRQVDGT